MHVSELSNQPHLAETSAGKVTVLFFKNSASAAEIVEFIIRSLVAVMLKNEALVTLSASSLLSPINFTRSSSTLVLTKHKHIYEKMSMITITKVVT
jgi:hypothetical protein